MRTRAAGAQLAKSTSSARPLIGLFEVISGGCRVSSRLEDGATRVEVPGDRNLPTHYPQVRGCPRSGATKLANDVQLPLEHWVPVVLTSHM